VSVGLWGCHITDTVFSFSPLLLACQLQLPIPPPTACSSPISATRDDTPPSTPLWQSSHSVPPFEACAVRFRIRGQAVCFVAAHLNAGDGEAKYERRIAGTPACSRARTHTHSQV
jgi:hypothetical protein